MKKSFSVDSIKDVSKFKKKFDVHTKIRIVGNQVVVGRSEVEKERLDVANAVKFLAKNKSIAPGVVEAQSPRGRKDSVLDSSEALLEAVGCTIGKKKLTFSFLDEQKLETGNPNIVDAERAKKLKNKQKDAKGTHPNSADPFYDLDEDIPRRIKLQNKNLKKAENADAIINLAAAISRANLGKSGPTLKYFMK